MYHSVIVFKPHLTRYLPNIYILFPLLKYLRLSKYFIFSSVYPRPPLCLKGKQSLKQSLIPWVKAWEIYLTFSVFLRVVSYCNVVLERTEHTTMTTNEQFTNKIYSASNTFSSCLLLSSCVYGGV